MDALVARHDRHADHAEQKAGEADPAPPGVIADDEQHDERHEPTDSAHNDDRHSVGAVGRRRAERGHAARLTVGAGYERRPPMDGYPSFVSATNEVC